MAKADAKTKRLYSLDVLRGITVAAMIIVNNGAGPDTLHFLEHSDWNGLTLCDMVFPTFLYIVGITAYISLGGGKAHWSAPLAAKILRRTVIIMLIGWLIHWIEMLCKGHGADLGQLRLTGVLPRIALCYCLVSVCALTFSKRFLAWLVVALLLVYSIVLWYGDGMVNDTSNILSRADRWLLGEEHLYTKRPIDPEGLVGTISCVAHTLIGFLCGSVLFDKSRAVEDRLLRLMCVGFALLLCGWGVEQVFPFNKRVWTPSYALAACGLASLALGLIGYITDVRGRKRMFWPFDVFGVNPLFLYALSELAAIAMSATAAKGALYGALASGLPGWLASLAYALIFVLAMWIPGYYLYLKKIYIKI